MRNLIFVLLATACSGDDTVDAWDFPSTGPTIHGPGLTDRAFAESELFRGCAFLSGGPNDVDHHNLLVPFDGWLMMPWAPEYATHGGISLFDMSDPCTPALAGQGEDPTMRETHATGFAVLPEGDHAGRWAVTNWLKSIYEGGLMFWNMDDPAAPTPAGTVAIEGFLYPDAYARVQLSVAWQYPWAYAAMADGGVAVIDATDPTAPVQVSSFVFDGGLRVGQVVALGNLLFVSAAEGSKAAFLDISVPDSPTLLPGSPFDAVDRDGVARDAYFSNLVGDMALFARKEDGGGPIIMDVSDPTAPAFQADFLIADASGGYIFYDEGFLFIGGSSRADVVDARRGDTLLLEGTAELSGDLDTVTPYGNLALLSVDDESVDGESTSVVPWSEGPDIAGPIVLRVNPPDGDPAAPITSRIGVSFNELIEPVSVYEGAIRLYRDDTNTPVRGWMSAQEAIGTFTPREPLEPGITYRVEVVAGGVQDPNGNTVGDAFTSRFTTAR